VGGVEKDTLISQFRRLKRFFAGRFTGQAKSSGNFAAFGAVASCLSILLFNLLD
jgi:hypothetical protein